MSVEDDLLDVMEEVTLNNCDREPIHVPGAIQPYGFLMTLVADDLRICQLSGNVDRWLGMKVEQLLGESIDRLIDAEAVAAIRALDAADGGQVAVTVAEVRTTDAPVTCDLTLHRSGGLVVCEFEPHVAANPESAAEVIANPGASVTGGVEQLFDRAASEVRQLTGYDRVMVYRFDGDGHGEVIGEALDSALDPLLGHHYPATDIPRQARALYLKQMIRMIVDTDYQPAAILPTENPMTEEPLDLGLATLRSVSPIHLQYLRNMGVTATLTISLIRDGELWGMIACHHYSAPRLVPYRTRAACRFIGELLSAQLSNVEALELARAEGALADARDPILRRIRDSESVPAGLRMTAQSLAELLAADGVAALTHAGRVCWGYVPSPGPEAEILDRVPPRRPLIIDRLARELPSLARHTELSGVLALPLPASVGTYIIWYRDDWARELKWGGDPNATLRPDLTSTDVKSLSPRRSFETWRQTVVGQSRPWSHAQINAAVELVEALATLHGARGPNAIRDGV